MGPYAVHADKWMVLPVIIKEVFPADIHKAFISHEIRGYLAVEYRIPCLFRKFRKITILSLCDRDVNEQICRIVILETLDIPFFLAVILFQKHTEEAVIIGFCTHALCSHDTAEPVKEFLLFLVFNRLQLLILIGVHCKILVREVYCNAVDTFSGVTVAVYNTRFGCLRNLIELLISRHLLLIISFFQICEVADHIDLLLVQELIGA